MAYFLNTLPQSLIDLTAVSPPELELAPCEDIYSKVDEDSISKFICLVLGGGPLEITLECLESDLTC